MQFKDIPGHDSIKNYLSGAIDQGTLPHALLFLGASGLGLLPMALATAKYLMCEHRSAYNACNQCSNCHKASKLIHPDIHYSYPTIGSKVTSLDLINEWRSFVAEKPYGDVYDWLASIGGENKQGNINKDECHRILKALSLKTYEGEYKIHLLWMAEYLGKEGNRLLKILEEPPPKTVFILMASDQDAILNTILSRCQLVSFGAVEDDELLKYSRVQAPNLTEDQHTQVVYLAEGSVGKLETYLADGSQIATELWLEWMRVAYKGNPIALVQWSDKFAKMDREAQKRFLNYGLHFLREMMLHDVNGEQGVRLPAKEKDVMVKLKSLIPFAQLEAMMNMLNESIFQLERNANGRILMLDNSIHLHKIFVPESQLITT